MICAEDDGCKALEDGLWQVFDAAVEAGRVSIDPKTAARRRTMEREMCRLEQVNKHSHFSRNDAFGVDEGGIHIDHAAVPQRDLKWLPPHRRAV